MCYADTQQCTSDTDHLLFEIRKETRLCRHQYVLVHIWAKSQLTDTYTKANSLHTRTYCFGNQALSLFTPLLQNPVITQRFMCMLCTCINNHFTAIFRQIIPFPSNVFCKQEIRLTKSEKKLLSKALLKSHMR